jgi:UTP--glucose-1-phosphate uridylyltransferase
MEKEGIAPSAISAFESTFNSLMSGDTGMILEDTITPVPDLDRADNFTTEPNSSLLSKTVVLKLNGGLGTGMGLDKAKSLLKVKGEDTFLDLTAKQVIQMRKDYGYKVKFMLMNSFSTSADTLAFFQEKYPGLAGEDGLEMMQNKVPKLRADNYEVRCCCCCVCGDIFPEGGTCTESYNLMLPFLFLLFLWMILPMMLVPACGMHYGRIQRMVPTWTW